MAVKMCEPGRSVVNTEEWMTLSKDGLYPISRPGVTEAGRPWPTFSSVKSIDMQQGKGSRLMVYDFQLHFS